MNQKMLDEIKAREQAAMSVLSRAELSYDAEYRPLLESVSDIKRLIAEVEQLTAENAELNAQIEPYQRELHCVCDENATLKKTFNEASRKSKNALALVKTDAKIIQGLHKCPNSKVEILYARDLAAKIEECADYIKNQLAHGPDEVTHGETLKVDYVHHDTTTWQPSEASK